MDYLRDALNEKDDTKALCSILKTYIEPIHPIHGNFIQVYGRGGLYSFQCVFIKTDGEKGFYISVYLRKIQHRGLRDMQWFCSYARKLVPPKLRLKLIEPASTIILFHIYLNYLADKLPIEENKLMLRKLK